MSKNIHETEAWWFERMLDKSNMVTSYKAYWMMSIIDIVVETDNANITFEEIVNRMLVHAWYPTVTFKLSFGVQDRLSHLVDYLSANYPLLNSYKRDQLLEFISSSQTLKKDKFYQTKHKELFQMVPYRLLSPFFKTVTRGIKDQKKNRIITELSQESEHVFYSIDRNNLSIQIRDNWMKYIIENQAVVKGWIQYKLVLYLQARNPNVPNIPLKLNPPGSRNLSQANKFWKEVVTTSTITDIYTGRVLESINFSEYGGLSIDHFIPWSFVTHDEFWNLCPTFKNINSSKNDSLPDLNSLLEKYTELHFDTLRLLKKMNKRTLLQDYYTIGNDELNYFISHDDFTLKPHVLESALKKSIEPIHQIALNQGFSIWEGY